MKSTSLKLLGLAAVLHTAAGWRLRSTANNTEKIRHYKDPEKVR